MTVEDINQIEDKNPSIELRDMIVRYTHTSVERTQLVKQIMDKANSEGIPNQQIRDMIVTEFNKMQLSDRTIRRYLPDELKDSKMQEIRKHEHKPLEDTDTVPVLEVDRHAPVYREPDRVEPRPVWNKDSMDTVQEQSFRTSTMTVTPNIPVQDKIERDMTTVVREIQEAGFDFTNLPDIWTDTGSGMAKEFLLPENRDKQFKILVEK